MKPYLRLIKRLSEIWTKPWNLRRHSALTEKSLILKEHVLRDHAGWTMTSKMPQVCIHYFGTESSKSLLEARGIVKERDKRIVALRSKQCPNCNEPNKPDSKFCAKCRMVLTYDAYSETIEKKQEKETEVQKLKEQVRLMQESQTEILALLKDPGRQIISSISKLSIPQEKNTIVKNAWVSMIYVIARFITF